MQSDQVTRYLLGQLPESEIQRLNLLRETDENFRQRVAIVEDDLIDCFTKGQLQGEDLMRFRRYFLAAAANRERVKVAQGFLDDLRVVQLDAPPTLWERVLPTSLKTSLADFWERAGENFWGTVREPLLIGLQGIGLVFIVWCLYLVIDLMRLRNRSAELQANEEVTQPVEARPTQPATPAPTDNQLAQQVEQSREQLGQLKAAALSTEPTTEPSTAPLAVNAAELQPASFNLRPAARGAEGVPELAVNPATDDVAFQLELGRDDRASYRAELRAQPDGSRLWQSGTLKARAKDYGKVLEVRVPAALLKSRAYTLKVYGTSNTGNTEEALNYSFRINKP